MPLAHVSCTSASTFSGAFGGKLPRWFSDLAPAQNPLLAAGPVTFHTRVTKPLISVSPLCRIPTNPRVLSAPQPDCCRDSLSTSLHARLQYNQDLTSPQDSPMMQMSKRALLSFSLYIAIQTRIPSLTRAPSSARAATSSI